MYRQLPMESENLAPVQTAVSTPNMTQDMRSITNNGSDPFLNRQVHCRSPAILYFVAEATVEIILPSRARGGNFAPLD